MHAKYYLIPSYEIEKFLNSSNPTITPNIANLQNAHRILSNNKLNNATALNLFDRNNKLHSFDEKVISEKPNHPAPIQDLPPPPTEKKYEGGVGGTPADRVIPSKHEFFTPKESLSPVAGRVSKRRSNILDYQIEEQSDMDSLHSEGESSQSGEGGVNSAAAIEPAASSPPNLASEGLLNLATSTVPKSYKTPAKKLFTKLLNNNLLLIDENFDIVHNADKIPVNKLMQGVFQSRANVNNHRAFFKNISKHVPDDLIRNQKLKDLKQNTSPASSRGFGKFSRVKWITL